MVFLRENFHHKRLRRSWLKSIAAMERKKPLAIFLLAALIAPLGQDMTTCPRVHDNHNQRASKKGMCSKRCIEMLSMVIGSSWNWIDCLDLLLLVQAEPLRRWCPSVKRVLLYKLKPHQNCQKYVKAPKSCLLYMLPCTINPTVMLVLSTNYDFVNNPCFIFWLVVWNIFHFFSWE